MNYMVKLIVLVPAWVVLWVWPNELKAQSDFQKGYVVIRENDTLYGSVRDRKTGAFSRLYDKIRFKGKSGKRKYAPKDLIAYKKGNTTYEALQVLSTGSLFDDEYRISSNGTFQFFRVVERGYLSYYLLEYEDADSGYVDTIAYFKKRDSNRLVRVNQGLFGLKRKKLGAYFSDCPLLAERIRNKEIKQPLEILHFYNSWKAEQR